MAKTPPSVPLIHALAANVRRKRTRLGLTQEDLAQKSGIALRYIQVVESGQGNVTLAVLALLADALDVAAPQLLRAAKFREPTRGRPAGIVERRPRRRN